MKVVRIKTLFTGIVINRPLVFQFSEDRENWKEMKNCVVYSKNGVLEEVEIPTESWKVQREFLEGEEGVHFLVEDNIKYYRILNTCSYCLESKQGVAAEGEFKDDPYND